MSRRTRSSTPPDTLIPYTPPFRSRLTGLTKICFGRLTGWAAADAGAKRCQRHAGPRPPLASAVTRRCLGLEAPAAQRLGKRLAKSKQILAAWVEPLAVQERKRVL